MNSHDLAKKLLELPNLPIATHANNHEFLPSSGYDSTRIALLETNSGKGNQYIIIGNFSRKALNAPNWFVSKVLDDKKDIPTSWRESDISDLILEKIINKLNNK